MLCLDIGSGSGTPNPSALEINPHGKWVTVDLYVDDADIQAPMDDLPFQDNTVDTIYCSHALEHVGKYDVPATLREWRRVLRPNGMLVIVVPDLEWCVQHWLNHKESTGWDLDILFGNQNHDGEFHKTGFTMYTLESYVRNAGFKLIGSRYILSHSQQSIQLSATK